MKVSECALCLIVWDENDMSEAAVTFAFDTGNSKTYWICKDRSACNTRRHQRFLAQLAYNANKA